MKPPIELRARLREATAAAHERMHSHPGFGAAAAGHISRSAYRHLLQRLYGFHRAFERAMAAGAPTRLGPRGRSMWLVEDLRALGSAESEIAALPLCGEIAVPRSEAQALGALYVLEGSTLGGVQIARALSASMPAPDGAGRRFFLGYGAAHGAMWRAFVEALESYANDPEGARQATEAAIATFDEFELWMGENLDLYCDTSGPDMALSKRRRNDDPLSENRHPRLAPGSGSGA